MTLKKIDGPTDGWTDQQMDQQTDGPTNKAGCREEEEEKKSK